MATSTIIDYHYIMVREIHIAVGANKSWERIVATRIQAI